jgi:hypothetical protein
LTRSRPTSTKSSPGPLGPKSRFNDQADNSLEALTTYANSLAEKVGGPLAEAYAKYSDRLERADSLAEKAVISGANVDQVIEQQNRAYTNATAALGKDIAAITLRNEKLAEAPNAKLLDDTSKYIQSIDDETAALEARLGVGDALTPSEQAEVFIKQKLADASGKVSDAYRTEADTIRKNAAALTELQVQEKLQQTLAGGIDALLESTRQGVIAGQGAFEALGNAAGQVLPGVAKQIGDIISKLDGAKDGTASFTKVLNGLGDSLEKELPALGQLLGTIAGGGGNGAQIGSSIGSIAGGIIGGIIPGVGNLVGAAVGGLIGGIIGGQGDGGGTPRIYASSIPGSVGRDGTKPVDTPFGIFAADTDNLSDDAYKQFESTVRGFDQQLAKLFDPSQLDAVTNALKNFSGKFSDINALLTARFAVILGTFDDSIKNFVTGFASDLQGQVQALADVLQLQKLDNAGLLITSSLSDALDLITEFSQSGERVTDTYQRIVTSTNDYKQALALMGVAFDGSKTQLAEFAQNISDAVGSTQAADALWQEFFKDFYSQSEITAGNITLLQSKAADSLTKVGLSADISMQDFRDKFTAALPKLSPDEIANWLQAGVALGQLNNAITSLIQQGESLVDQLYGGGSLSDVNSEITDLQGRADDAAADARRASENVTHFGSAMTSAANAAKSAADLLLGALSPLNDQQKLQVALQGLRNGTVSQEQVLTIGRQLYASSQAYNQLFAMVRAIGDHTGVNTSGGSLRNNQSDTSDQHKPLTPEEQDRLTQLIARRDTLEEQQRKQEARDLATTVATLGLTQKESFKQVSDELGFNLDDLAKDLGLTNDQLTTYLTNIQAQQTAIPDAVTDGSDRVVRALYDIAGRTPPDGALGDTQRDTSGGTPFGSDSQVGQFVGNSNITPRGHSQHSRGGTAGDTDTVTVTAPSHTTTATFVDAQLVANAKLDAILAATRDVVAAVNQGVDATRTVTQTLRTPSPLPRRNARAGL